VRRVLYFILTNIAVLAVFSIVLAIISPFLPPDVMVGNGGALLFAAIFGFTGSLVSLFMSKSMAKRSAGVQIIEQPRNATEQWLVDTVARQAKAAGIGMPEVGIFPAPEMNAFATGANKNNALVAVSAGLLNNMTREEAEAVLGHEVAHVANGDMITLTLIQGVMNTFVIFFARIVAQIVDRNGRGIGFFATYMIAQVVFGFIAGIVVAFFSRQREYRADAGGAEYASRAGMIAALERLKQGQAGELPDQLAAFGINTGVKSLFSTHPPLDQRIQALKNAQ
jgi:heat shock protein HtpX